VWRTFCGATDERVDDKGLRRERLQYSRVEQRARLQSLAAAAFQALSKRQRRGIDVPSLLSRGVLGNAETVSGNCLARQVVAQWAVTTVVEGVRPSPRRMVHGSVVKSMVSVPASTRGCRAAGPGCLTDVPEPGDTGLRVRELGKALVVGEALAVPRGPSSYTHRWLCSTNSVPGPGLRAHVLNSPRPASGCGQARSRARA